MMETPIEPAIRKPKKLTSVVWNHFERVRRADVCYAVCVHCNKKLSGSSNSGTTHLRNHLLRCLKRSNFDVSQLLVAKRRNKNTTVTVANINSDEVKIVEEQFNTNVLKFGQEKRKNGECSLGNSKLDQERSRNDLARMIILHGYQLTMVDHVGFQAFVNNLQPLFEAVPNTELEAVCIELYMKEKHKLCEMIKKVNSRINLAVDVWTSHGISGYLSLTAHYIDEDWRLQKKILNFISLESSLTENMLSEIIIKCLMEWNLDRKLFAMTFNDIFTNDENVLRIKHCLAQSRPLLSEGNFFDVRCAANFLKFIVQEAMDALRDVTQKIRESVRHVKSSQATQTQFNEISQQVGINIQNNLLLDSPLRWDSTYHMLKISVDYRSAFSLLQEHDITYMTVLSDTEWEWATSVTGYLKLLVDVITDLSTTKSATANLYFPEICDIHIQLIELSKNADDFISSLASRMKTKFDSYWSKCSLSLALAAVLDPRFKMKLVEYYYPQIYGNSSLDKIKDVANKIRELFDAYSMETTSSSENQCLALPSTSSILPSTSKDRLRGFDHFLHETSQNESIITDLDKYLVEPVFPRHLDFNILNWWKVHTARYPILSMMSRDVLGIPMLTISPELAFSTEGKRLDKYWSSLNPDTREALICSQDWLRTEYEDIKPSSSCSSSTPFR